MYKPQSGFFGILKLKYFFLRQRIYRIIENPEDSDKAGWVFNVFLFILIIFNIAATMAETLPEWHRAWEKQFLFFDLLSVIFFTVEYLVRIWCSAEKSPKSPAWKPRLAHIFSFLSIIDLLAIMPFYLPLIMQIDMRILRVLRLFRLLRIFKIGRYSDTFISFLRVFRRKKDFIFIIFFTVFAVIVLSSGFMYYFENSSQPREYKSIFHAMWWGIITITTVGYGDIYPVTAAGRIIGGLVALLGIGLVAIPSGVVGAAFLEDLEKTQQGKISRIDMEDHIIICGYTEAAGVLLRRLKNSEFAGKVIIASRRKDIDFYGYKFVNVDFTDITISGRLVWKNAGLV
ncbi:MAG TPA: hypothetical protein DC049_17450 [Spirochaetia bacterium]|nr:hypothetical protein [Spirochaetia bacterium]